MIPGLMAVDPGVGGGVAWTDWLGDAHLTTLRTRRAARYSVTTCPGMGMTSTTSAPTMCSRSQSPPFTNTSGVR